MPSSAVLSLSVSLYWTLVFKGTKLASWPNRLAFMMEASFMRMCKNPSTIFFNNVGPRDTKSAELWAGYHFSTCGLRFAATTDTIYGYRAEVKCNKIYCSLERRPVNTLFITHRMQIIFAYISIKHITYIHMYIYN